MCPIWPIHLIILYMLAMFPLWVLCQTAPVLTASFDPQAPFVHMQEYMDVAVSINGTGMAIGDEFVLSELTDRDKQIAEVEWNSTNTITALVDDAVIPNTNRWHGTIRVIGNFLGRVDLNVTKRRGSESFDISGGALRVTVTRPERVIDTIFVASVATFVSLIFINFGCAMDWPIVKETIRRPVGPLIGLAGQFLFLPLLSFGLGFVIFPNEPALRLGMFFTGVAPGGGASNIWTFILGGNLNLSLAMSSISTLASFVLIPAWLFSLGQITFRDAEIRVPYVNIATFVIGLLVPLGIGLGMQRWTPKVARFMVRILKGFSTTLLLFIIVFAIVTNLYIFELFSYGIVLAGMCIPWLGYLTGYFVARLLRQNHPDALAISIETGITNTGIAIFMLRHSLDQPDADLTTVIPVAVAIMTPIPMTCIYIYQKIKACTGGMLSNIIELGSAVAVSLFYHFYMVVFASALKPFLSATSTGQKASSTEEKLKRSLKKPTPPYQGRQSPQSSQPLMSQNSNVV